MPVTMSNIALNGILSFKIKNIRPLFLSNGFKMEMHKLLNENINNTSLLGA